MKFKSVISMTMWWEWDKLAPNHPCHKTTYGGRDGVQRMRETINIHRHLFHVLYFYKCGTWTNATMYKASVPLMLAVRNESGNVPCSARRPDTTGQRDFHTLHLWVLLEIEHKLSCSLNLNISVHTKIVLFSSLKIIFSMYTALLHSRLYVKIHQDYVEE